MGEDDPKFARCATFSFSERGNTVIFPFQGCDLRARGDEYTQPWKPFFEMSERDCGQMLVLGRSEEEGNRSKAQGEERGHFAKDGRTNEEVVRSATHSAAAVLHFPKRHFYAR